MEIFKAEQHANATTSVKRKRRTRNEAVTQVQRWELAGPA
jgi:hypothetical protein